MSEETKPRRKWNGMNWIQKSKRLSIYLRDNWRCVYCDKHLSELESLTLDHIKPIALGGSNSHLNLVTCCSTCNSSKGKRTGKEFAKSISKQAYLRVQNRVRRKLPTKEVKELLLTYGGYSEVIEKIKFIL